MAGVARGLRLKGSAKAFTSIWDLKQARIAVVLQTVEKTCETPLLTYTGNKLSHFILGATQHKEWESADAPVPITYKSVSHSLFTSVSCSGYKCVYIFILFFKENYSPFVSVVLGSNHTQFQIIMMYH